MKRIWFALTMMVFAGLVGWVEAQENNANRPGQVQLPLEIYTQLIQQAQPGDRHAPVNFALGNARVSVTVRSLEPAASAEISVALSIQIFEDEWALVPVLPAGTPVTQATVQGTPVSVGRDALRPRVDDESKGHLRNAAFLSHRCSLLRERLRARCARSGSSVHQSQRESSRYRARRRRHPRRRRP